jgi:hypothetical protein
MNTTATPFAMTIGLAGVLALIEGTGSFAPIRPKADASTRVSQYCVPLEETADAHRLYCRTERG